MRTDDKEKLNMDHIYHFEMFTTYAQIDQLRLRISIEMGKHRAYYTIMSRIDMLFVTDLKQTIDETIHTKFRENFAYE